MDNAVNKEKVKEYEEFVIFCLNKFGTLSDLIRDDEIDPNELNLALGSYLKVTNGLLSEYQKSKMNDFYVSMNYDEWYAEKFEECKKEVIADYVGHNEGFKNKTDMIKPSLKEFNNRVQYKYKKEMREWKEKVMLANSEMRFILRLLETLKKYDDILTTISNNMRQEMRSLSAINRANLSDENKVSSYKVRGDFPEVKRNTSKRQRVLSEPNY